MIPLNSLVLDGILRALQVTQLFMDINRIKLYWVFKKPNSITTFESFFFRNFLMVSRQLSFTYKGGVSDSEGAENPDEVIAKIQPLNVARHCGCE